MTLTHPPEGISNLAIIAMQRGYTKLAQLKDNIQAFIVNAPDDMLVWVEKSFKNLLSRSFDQNEGHLNDVIFEAQ